MICKGLFDVDCLFIHVDDPQIIEGCGPFNQSELLPFFRSVEGEFPEQVSGEHHMVMDKQQAGFVQQDGPLELLMCGEVISGSDDAEKEFTLANGLQAVFGCRTVGANRESTAVRCPDLISEARQKGIESIEELSESVNTG